MKWGKTDGSKTITPPNRWLIRLVGMLLFTACWFDVPLMFAQEASQEATSGSTNSIYGDIPPAEQIELTLLRDLWSSQLFRLAEGLCQQHLETTAPNSDAAVNWLRWLMQTKTRRAIEEGQSDGVLATIDRMVAEFEAVDGSARRIEWVRSEQIACQRLVAAQSMARYAAAAADADARSTALEIIRQSLASSEELERRLLVSLPNWTQSPNGTRTTPPSKDAQNLVLENALLQADLLFLRAEAYAIGSPDRLAVAASVIQKLQEAAKRLSKDWPGFGSFELAYAKAQVLQQRADLAIPRLMKIADRPGIDPKLRQNVMATLLAAYRQSDQLEDAQRLLDTIGPDASTPDIELERLGLILDDLADDTSLRQQQLRMALAQRKSIAENFGVYWAQRADALLVRATGRTVSPTGDTTDTRPVGNSETPPSMINVELLQTQAKQLIASDKLGAAAEVLARAEQLASEASLVELAFQLALQQSAVLRKADRHNESIDLLITASRKYSSASKAATSHFAAAWLLSQAIVKASQSAAPTDSTAGGKTQQIEKLVKKYRDVLAQQASRWPADANSRTALLWLDQSLAAESEVGQAAQAWSDAAASIEPTDETAAKEYRLMSLARQAFDRASSRCRQLGGPVPIIDESKLDLPTAQLLGDYRWSIFDGLARRPANAATPRSPRPSELPANTSLDLTWQRIANAVADPSLKQLATVQEIFAEPRPKAPSFRSRLLDILSWPVYVILSERISNEINLKNIDSRELVSVTLLDRIEAANEPIDPNWLLLCRARLGGTLTSNERAALEQQLRAQVKLEPRNVLARWSLASLLGHSKNPADHQSARLEFRRIAAGNKPATEAWLAAKFRAAEMSVRLGEVDAALGDCELILAAYPDLPANWSRRFTSLKNQIEEEK
jgi:hypothetical protein